MREGSQIYRRQLLLRTLAMLRLSFSSFSCDRPPRYIIAGLSDTAIRGHLLAMGNQPPQWPLIATDLLPRSPSVHRGWGSTNISAPLIKRLTMAPRRP